MADSSLDERVVVIAGAAGGLGAAATAVFAETGARLVLLGRNSDKLNELAGDLKLSDERVLAQASNVSDQKEVDSTTDAIVKKFKRIDVLLNFVGGWIGGKPVLETNKDDLDAMLDQHLYSTYAMVRSFVPVMVKGKWGRVLTVSSPNASRPPGNNSPYAVGKSAMEALTISLAQELKGSGVTANLVLVKKIDVAHERQINPSEANRSWTSPEEISATLLHLCSEEAGVINGARIPLFGEPL